MRLVEFEQVGANAKYGLCQVLCCILSLDFLLVKICGELDILQKYSTPDSSLDISYNFI
jgi:hypothetical protein